MPRIPSLPSFTKRYPATAVLIALNLSWFAYTVAVAGSLTGSSWALTLLRLGALFNPLTLDKEWYRIFSHLFLHGGVIHLSVNLYLLGYLGYRLEPKVGTRKFVFLFIVCGLAAALSGLYWNLFTVGLGTSGAIFGLLGFALVRSLYFSGRNARPMVLLLLHFAAFVTFHLLLPEAMYTDYAAYFGGVIAGITIGFLTFSTAPRTALPNVRFEYVMIVLLFLTYFLLPRNQVRYFRFFKQVVAAEDSTKHRFKADLTDDAYMRGFIKNYHHWDDVLGKLRNQTNLPVDLSTDTFKLRKYISLRKQENHYKKLVVQREAYVYLDSVDHVHRLMKPYLALDYALWSRIKLEAEPDSAALRKMDEVFYDSSGFEATPSSAAYYRVGYRDSLGRWDGAVQEYYINGNIKMKGAYKHNKREGVFIFYSESNHHTEAGRYVNDRRFGKWETFHPNGKLASEVYYNNSYFLQSLYDSVGNQLVVDGNGREVQRYPNGVVATEGEYRHGVKEGYWYGRYPSGELYFEEIFSGGVLVSGQSRTPSGETFVYDNSSLLPLPTGGYDRFTQYLKAETSKTDAEMGHVKISFQVARNGSIADLSIDQSASPLLDQKARDIILNGPGWLPARRHGHEPIDARAYVQVEFY